MGGQHPFGFWLTEKTDYSSDWFSYLLCVDFCVEGFN